MTTRLRGPLLVSALGAALLLLLTTERGSVEPGTPAPVASVAKPQPVPAAPPSPPRKSEGSAPRAASAPAAPALVLKTIEQYKPPAAPAPETPAPVETVVPPAATPTANPNSVFGWGPWTGGTAQGSDNSALKGDNGSVPAAPGQTQTVSFSSPGGGSSSSPPGITPPPVVSPPSVDFKPGHGFGDRNHTHVHRR